MSASPTPTITSASKPVKEAFPDARVIAASGDGCGHQGQCREEARRLGAAAQGERPADARRYRHSGSLRRPDAHRRRRDHRDRRGRRARQPPLSLGAVAERGVRRRADLLGRACLDRRHADQGTARRLDRQSRQDRGAQAGDRRSRPHDADSRRPISPASSTPRPTCIAFEEELAKAKDSAALKAAMEARFPDLGMGVALDIGSKVATGEMKWG